MFALNNPDVVVESLELAKSIAETHGFTELWFQHGVTDHETMCVNMIPNPPEDGCRPSANAKGELFRWCHDQMCNYQNVVSLLLSVGVVWVDWANGAILKALPTVFSDYGVSSLTVHDASPSDVMPLAEWLLKGKLRDSVSSIMFGLRSFCLQRPAT